MDIVCKRTLAEVEASEADGVRKVNFTVSSGALDRDGDTVAPDGWVLDHYRKNPVVLWHHDSSIPPIAKSESIDVVDGQLKAVTVFPKKGDYPFADTVFNLLQGGFVRMASVGFQPLEKEPSEKGIDFKKQELYEWSILPIGAKPRCPGRGQGGRHQHRAGPEVGARVPGQARRRPRGQGVRRPGTARRTWGF